MSQSPPVIHLICPANIQWVRDAEQILVVDERSGAVHTLAGVEAAVWSWLALAYSYRQIVDFLVTLLGASPAEAEQRLAAVLQGWCESGLLEIEAATDD